MIGTVSWRAVVERAIREARGGGLIEPTHRQARDEVALDRGVNARPLFNPVQLLWMSAYEIVSGSGRERLSKAELLGRECITRSGIADFHREWTQAESIAHLSAMLEADE